MRSKIILLCVFLISNSFINAQYSIKGKDWNAKEKLIDKLHVNLKGNYTIEFRARTTEIYENISGLRWVGSMPDDIKVY